MNSCLYERHCSDNRDQNNIINMSRYILSSICAILYLLIYLYSLSSLCFRECPKMSSYDPHHFKATFIAFDVIQPP